MYIYDQDRTSSVPLGIGRLDDFGKSPKKTEPDPAQAILLEEQIRTLAAKARQLDDEWTKARELDGKWTEVPAPMGFWNGVDRAYENWLKVRGETDMTKWEIHQTAAEAAKRRGDATSRYRRVWIALKLLKRANGPSDQRKELGKEKKDLEDNWARVEIRLMRRLKSDIVYPVPRRPIRRSDGAAAFKRASEELRERRRFDGLLLLEPFEIDGQEISLKYDCALSLASVVRVFQKKDGTFDIDCKPRPAAAEIDPLLIE